MDIIKKMYPLSIKRHSFILVAVDYFTKWLEVESCKNITKKTIVEFINQYIIHQFGIPKTIIADWGTVFTDNEVSNFI